MYSFKVTDVNRALQFGLEHLLNAGVEEQSRNGPVLVAPEPVMTEYLNPRARVLFSPTRDANPFFHFFESLWMLSGANDIEFPCYFNRSYAQYSDDGKTMWDAYGCRWRNFFRWDQLDAIAVELKNNPNTRRAVLTMWDAGHSRQWFDTTGSHGVCDDFWVATQGGKAVPCNTQAYFDARGGRLNMTLLCRSNDAVLGAYGANAVHFSFLLEYMAMKTGYPVGLLRQFSNNLHVYTDRHPRKWLETVALESAEWRSEDSTCQIEEGFDEDLEEFMFWARSLIEKKNLSQKLIQLRTSFFTGIAVPMFLGWHYRKEGTPFLAFTWLSEIREQDWRVACQEWIRRREKTNDLTVA